MSLGADMLPMLTEIGMKCLEGGLNRLRPFFPEDAEYVNPNQAEVVDLVADHRVTTLMGVGKRAGTVKVTDLKKSVIR